MRRGRLKAHLLAGSRMIWKVMPEGVVLALGLATKTPPKMGLRVWMGNKEHSRLGRKWGNSFDYFWGTPQIGTSHLERGLGPATL